MREHTTGSKCQTKCSFYLFIWNHHEKCIQKNTNMPGTGEIDVNISEIEKANIAYFFGSVKPMASLKCKRAVFNIQL